MAVTLAHGVVALKALYRASNWEIAVAVTKGIELDAMWVSVMVEYSDSLKVNGKVAWKVNLGQVDELVETMVSL